MISNRQVKEGFIEKMKFEQISNEIEWATMRSKQRTHQVQNPQHRYIKTIQGVRVRETAALNYIEPIDHDEKIGFYPEWHGKSLRILNKEMILYIYIYKTSWKYPWLLYGEWTIGKDGVERGSQVGRLVITKVRDDGVFHQG